MWFYFCLCICPRRLPVPPIYQMKVMAGRMPLRKSNTKSSEFKMVDFGASAGRASASTPPLALQWCSGPSRSLGANSESAEVSACATDSQDLESAPQDQIALLAAASKKRKPLLALPAVESEAPKSDCSKPVGQRKAKPALVQEPKAKKQKGSGAEQVPKELKEKSGAEQVLKGLKEKLEEKKWRRRKNRKQSPKLLQKPKPKDKRLCRRKKTDDGKKKKIPQQKLK